MTRTQETIDKIFGTRTAEKPEPSTTNDQHPDWLGALVDWANTEPDTLPKVNLERPLTPAERNIQSAFATFEQPDIRHTLVEE